jgi:hypothetical protein
VADSESMPNHLSWLPTGHFFLKVDLVDHKLKCRPILGNSGGNGMVKFDLHLTDAVESLSYCAALQKLGLDGFLSHAGRNHAGHLLKSDLQIGYHQAPIAPQLWPTSVYALPKLSNNNAVNAS